MRMQYRKLGRSGLDVSAIALGGWSLIGDFMWGEQDEADSIAAVQAAIDAGITLIDTAEGYGDGASEALIGKAIAGRRDQVVLASKVSAANLAPRAIEQHCETSLTRLNTECIDLYQIHWPNWDLPLDESLRALEALRDAGKIRAIGVSNFARRDLSEALGTSAIVSDQLPYSLLWRVVEHEIQSICVEHGVGILCYSPLLHGLLTGKFADADAVPDSRARTRHFAANRPQARHGEDGCEAETFATIERIRAACERRQLPMAQVALAWLLTRPAVSSVIVGVRNAAQVARNVAAAELVLDDELLAELDAATRPLRDRFGANADMWQPAERSRMR